MKYYVGNQSEISAEGATVGEALADALKKYPALKPHLFDSNGELRRHFNIFVNGVHIRELKGLQTPIGAEDKILLVASAAGG